MEKKYAQLVPLVDKYIEELKAVSARRDNWQNILKPLLQITLQDLIAHFKLDGYVGIEDSFENQESIYLAFNDVPSGIEEKESNHVFIKHGGGIMYTQNANGKISAMIIYPYIEELKGQEGTTKDLGMFKPNQIDETTIIGHVEDFFRETLQWECFLREPIGYKV
jgi:hypothetical protein